MAKVSNNCQLFYVKRVMVPHQPPSVQLPIGLLASFTEGFQKQFPVLVRAEDHGSRPGSLGDKSRPGTGLLNFAAPLAENAKRRPTRQSRNSTILRTPLNAWSTPSNRGLRTICSGLAEAVVNGLHGIRLKGRRGGHRYNAVKEAGACTGIWVYELCRAFQYPVSANRKPIH